MAKYIITEQQYKKYIKYRVTKMLAEQNSGAFGYYKLFDFAAGEYIFRTPNNEFIYTIEDSWEEFENGHRLDIVDKLYDFIPDNESDNWRENVERYDIANALEDYLNYNQKHGLDILITNEDEFEYKQDAFLLINKRNTNEIFNDTLRKKVEEKIIK